MKNDAYPEKEIDALAALIKEWFDPYIAGARDSLVHDEVRDELVKLFDIQNVIRLVKIRKAAQDLVAKIDAIPLADSPIEDLEAAVAEEDRKEDVRLFPEEDWNHNPDGTITRKPESV